MDLKLEQTTKILKKVGFISQLVKPADEAHFGNWVVIALQPPLALRVTNDRGVTLDLMDSDTFQAGANESDWFNWDVVVRALGIQEESGEDQLWCLIRNFDAVETAFLRQNWLTTKDLLHKIEQDKRREFMQGHREPAHA